MDATRREMLRNSNLAYTNSSEPQLTGATRIEGEYHLGLAVTNLYVAQHGKLPSSEVLARLSSAIEVILADSPKAKSSNEAEERLAHAFQVIEAEA